MCLARKALSALTWGMSQNYDLCLRSSTLGLEQCAEIIVNAVLKSREK